MPNDPGAALQNVQKNRHATETTRLKKLIARMDVGELAFADYPAGPDTTNETKDRFRQRLAYLERRSANRGSW
jgi:hypothetical protein